MHEIKMLEIKVSNLNKYCDTLRQEILKLTEKLSNSYVTPPDTGPWRARLTEGKVYVESDDFSTDASLLVIGDFFSVEHKLNYAKSLAHKMNSTPPNYPTDDVIGSCICGSWPGGKCFKCKQI